MALYKEIVYSFRIFEKFEIELKISGLFKSNNTSTYDFFPDTTL